MKPEKLVVPSRKSASEEYLMKSFDPLRMMGTEFLPRILLI